MLLLWETLTVMYSFEPLIHRWPALRTAIAELEEKQKADPSPELIDRIEHAKLLDDVMTTEFSAIEETMNDMKLNNVITYEHLWTIFEPGTLVYASIDNQDRALRLQKSKYGQDADQNPVFCKYSATNLMIALTSFSRAYMQLR